MMSCIKVRAGVDLKKSKLNTPLEREDAKGSYKTHKGWILAKN
jgi:hypothetical protein